jgi:uncharacterized LabA/DUF88 family protein
LNVEPAVKRTVSFIDGQNLFYAVKEAFGYTYPNYEPVSLVTQLCDLQGWQLTQIRFYTGIPDKSDNPFWNHFWTAKLAVMGKRGIHVFSRSLRYRNQTVRLPDNSNVTFLVGQEKGIDVRLALDAVRLARQKAYDVALIFSQDQDLTEAVEEIKNIAVTQNRWIKVVSAYPLSPTSRNRRGIDKTDWLHINRAAYDACIDPRDYRPKMK